MSVIHEMIFNLEEGRGRHWLRVSAGVLALFLVLICYNWFCFRNMSTQEAMDSAQLARNIAEGKGYTTLFIRPLSINLLRRHAAKVSSIDASVDTPDPARVNGMHPDIANAPLYPLVIAGLMKLMPFDYRVDLKNRFWSTSAKEPNADEGRLVQSRAFRRYKPDFIISAFNQILLLVVAGLSFFLARRLFDLRTAILSTVLLLGTDLLWRFAISGLGTTFLLLVFSCLLSCLVSLEQHANDPDNQGAESPNLHSKRAQRMGLIYSALAGFLAGIGALIRYPFGWMIFPVFFFILLFVTKRKLLLSLVAVLAFTLPLLLWVVRNYTLSGTPFGTATFAVLQGGPLFPAQTLDRSLNANLDFPVIVFVKAAWLKFVGNIGPTIQNDLPRLGGTWVAGFFLFGLVVCGKDPRARRLGCFLAMTLLVLATIQAAIRSQLSVDSVDINSENFLVLLVPGVWMYGASFFYRLLDQIHFPIPQLRTSVTCGFGLMTCLPMVLSLVAADRSPVAFPPYYPPDIQRAAGFVKNDELMMSDLPWAVAWYGHGRCMWLTQTKRDFFAINDHLKPIQALYLTHTAGAGQFERFDQWILGGGENWGDFIMGCVLQKQQGKPGPPLDFPLEYWQKGWPVSFLLTSRETAQENPPEVP